MKKFIFLACLAIVSVIIAATLITTNFDTSGYEVGDVATDFSLKNIDEKKVSLSDYSDAKGFIIAFTCNTCPFSVANQERLNTLNHKYKKSYPVIAINPNDPVKDGENYAHMQRRAREASYTFPYLFQNDQKIHSIYGAIKTPHVFLLNKENDQLIVRYEGAIDDSCRDADKVEKKFLENAVDALLAGRIIKVPSTKPIGCSIKG